MALFFKKFLNVDIDVTFALVYVFFGWFTVKPILHPWNNDFRFLMFWKPLSFNYHLSPLYSFFVYVTELKLFFLDLFSPYGRLPWLFYCAWSWTIGSERMLSFEPSDRPPAAAILKHPVFWNKETIYFNKSSCSYWSCGWSILNLL